MPTRPEIEPLMTTVLTDPNLRSGVTAKMISMARRTNGPAGGGQGDRGHLVIFEPSPLEVHSHTAAWFWDQEIYDFMGERLHLIRDSSMRHYVAAWELKQAGLDWRRAPAAAAPLAPVMPAAPVTP